MTSSRYAFLWVLPFVLACGDNSTPADGSVASDVPDQGDASDSDAGSDVGGEDAGPDILDLDMRAEDFVCIRDGEKVRKFYVTNPLGFLDEALAVANSSEGGTYPVGTVLQLVPLEAMVKRHAGWNPDTNDWEFFSLDVRAGETTILARGATDVINAFGGSCFGCHSLAAPEWDLVCEDTHGCDPLPLSTEVIESFQNADSRCE
ncbi:MAG: hypothetical protein ACI9KE_001901 [Polyangiales bacterium]|jgi:hypothetical protein